MKDHSTRENGSGWGWRVSLFKNVILSFEKERRIFFVIKLNLNFCVFRKNEEEEEEGTRIIIKKKLLKIPELKSYLTF